jgi:hypothetical protein
MRRKPTTFRRTLAAALTALATAAVAVPAFADEEGDEVPRMRGRLVPEEPDAEPRLSVKRLGAIRRADPFEAAREPSPRAAIKGPAAARPDQGNVVCEAGCDGPSGTIVYKPKQPAG